ncbi:MAG: hypothetical protein ACYTEG_15335 [Planctomycetota bacterium]
MRNEDRQRLRSAPHRPFEAPVADRVHLARCDGAEHQLHVEQARHGAEHGAALFRRQRECVDRARDAVRLVGELLVDAAVRLVDAGDRQQPTGAQAGTGTFAAYFSPMISMRFTITVK